MATKRSAMRTAMAKHDDNWRVTVRGREVSHSYTEKSSRNEQRFWAKAEPRALVCLERRVASKWRKVTCSGRKKKG